MTGKEPWNVGKPPVLWTPTEGQRLSTDFGAGMDFGTGFAAGLAIAVLVFLLVWR